MRPRDRRGRHRQPSVSHRHRAAPALSLVAVLVVCVALPAHVFAYASYTSSSVSLGLGQSGSATATCPAGQHVKFGGFESSVPIYFGQQAWVQPTGLRRTADGSWTVDGTGAGGTPSGAQPGVLTALAFCGYGPPLTKVVKTGNLGGRNRGMVAKCPAGSVVMAGGFKTTSPYLVSGLERVAPDEWRVSVVHDSGSVTAIAYCGAGPAPRAVTKTIRIARGGGTAHAGCPPRTSLIFGGMRAPDSYRGFDPLVIPFRFGAESATAWAVAGHTGYNGNGRLTAIAYCR